MPDKDSVFALFDGDEGTALGLADWLRFIQYAPSDDPANFFAAVDAARAESCWLALAADYSLGAAFEPSAGMPHGERPPLRAWVFGRGERLSKPTFAAFLAARLDALPAYQRVSGIADVALSVSEPGRSQKSVAGLPTAIAIRST